MEKYIFLLDLARFLQIFLFLSLKMMGGLNGTFTYEFRFDKNDKKWTKKLYRKYFFAVWYHIVSMSFREGGKILINFHVFLSVKGEVCIRRLSVCDEEFMWQYDSFSSKSTLSWVKYENSLKKLSDKHSEWKWIIIYSTSRLPHEKIKTIMVENLTCCNLNKSKTLIISLYRT